MVGKPVKIHIGVSRDLQERLSSGSTESIEALARRFELSSVRADRLGAFGVLTAEANEESVERLRQEPGVEFVETDSERGAI